MIILLEFITLVIITSFLFILRGFTKPGDCLNHFFAVVSGHILGGINTRPRHSLGWIFAIQYLRVSRRKDINLYYTLRGYLLEIISFFYSLLLIFDCLLIGSVELSCSSPDSDMVKKHDNKLSNHPFTGCIVHIGDEGEVTYVYIHVRSYLLKCKLLSLPEARGNKVYRGFIVFTLEYYNRVVVDIMKTHGFSIESHVY